MLEVLACPKCSAPLPKKESGEVVCPFCGSRLKFGAAEDVLTGDELAKRGVKAFREEKFEQALADFELALHKPRHEEKMEDILTLIGLCHEGAGRYDKAVSFHEKALAVNPRHHKAWVNLGITYRKNGNLEKAESCYQKAIEIQPKYAELHASLGALYISKGQPEAAIQACERAIALNPNVGAAYANLAIAYGMAGRFAEADLTLRKAILHGYPNAAGVQQRLDELRDLEK
jgi:tetratricopeptide (TPR) repeat protein